MLLSDNISHAREIFQKGGYTCVLCSGDTVLTSNENGLKPLIRFLSDNQKYSGFAAADKIVGNAASHLYILMDISAVHASVISKSAMKLLSEHNIKVSYDTLTDSIINRKGDDICPMEKAVAGITDSQKAFSEIMKTIKAMKH